ncbi:MAG: hypothetical protein ACK5JF_08775 [Oscillospiraceae bacterium]
MKNVVKSVAVSLSVLMLLLLVACGGGSKEVEGKWTLTGVEAMGQSISVDEMDEMGMGSIMDFTFEFKGGKVSVTSGGVTSGSIKYEYKDGVVTLNENGTEMTLEVNGEEMTMDFSGVKMIFARQK